MTCPVPPTDPPLERVAVALWVDAGGDPPDSDGRYPWDKESEWVKDRWRRSAKAALAAADWPETDAIEQKAAVAIARVQFPFPESWDDHTIERQAESFRPHARAAIEAMRRFSEGDA